MKKYFFISLITVLFLLGWVSLSVADTGIPRGKSAAPDVLPDELKSVKIDDYFVESKRSPVGSIQNVTGHLVVVHKDTNRAYFATTGDAVYQQDVFYTLKDSRCRIKFSTEDIITMGENSKVVADEIVDDRVSKKKSSVISMLKGKAMFYVVRLFKYKIVSASVKTPTAVMGVRGTKFGVGVRKVSEKVADLSDNSFIYLAQNEPGNFETVVYGFEGEVDVTSTADGSKNTVGAGENLVLDNTGAGKVEPTDPDAANQFIKETEGGGGGTGGTKGADAGEGEGGSTGDTGDNTSESIAQTLTGLAIDQLGPTGPTNRMGYFTAMLTRFDGYGYYNNGVFVSGSLQDLNGTDVSAGNILGGSTMNVDGLAGDDGKLASVTGGVYNLTGPYPISRTVLDHNAYMEWGYWTQTVSMPDGGGGTNWVNNWGYYIAGDHTPDDIISSLNQVWTYSGGAEGTYWTANTGLPGGGINMTGSFNATVDFSTPGITDFDLSVSGGGHSVSIANESGSFVGGGSDFVLGTTGTWLIDGGATANTAGYGSVYGPNAEAIGGVWGAKKDPSEYATGIFHGTR